MKYLVCALFTFLFFQVSGFAQSNYKPGLVVTLNGDTLRGFINHKEWEKNPEAFLFKATITQRKAQEYTAATSNYFEITGLEAYQRYEGEISADRIDTDNLPTRVSNKTRSILGFLRVLQAGPNVKLLSFTDILKVRYFIQEKDAKVPVELAFKRFMSADNQISNVRSYTVQLLKAAEKYNKATDDFKQELEISRYSGPDLLRLVSTINEVPFEQLREIEQINHKILWFVGLGLNRSITKAYFDKVLVNQFAKGSILPKAYFGFDTFLNPQVQRLFFRGELALTINDQKVEYSPSAKSVTRLQFKQLNASLIPQLFYNIYNTDNFKWYFGGGISANFSKYFNLEFANYSINPDGEEVVFESKEDDLYKLWITLPVRTGVNLSGKYDISIQYSMGSALAPVTNDYSYPLTSLHFQVSRYLNRK